MLLPQPNNALPAYSLASLYLHSPSINFFFPPPNLTIGVAAPGEGQTMRHMDLMFFRKLEEVP